MSFSSLSNAFVRYQDQNQNAASCVIYSFANLFEIMWNVKMAHEPLSHTENILWKLNDTNLYIYIYIYIYD